MARDRDSTKREGLSKSKTVGNGEDSKQSDIATARSALFAAVEGDNDDALTPLYSPRPFLNLFVSSNTSRSIIPKLSTRDQKQLLLDAVRSFSKIHARRFFSALNNIVNKVINEEEYIPESAYHEENNEDNENDDNNNDDDDDDEGSEIIADTQSSEALQFLNWSAVTVQTYLESLNEKHSNKKAQLSITGEVFEVAVSLHNILFQLNSCGPDAVAVQSTIVTLCEDWWQANGAQREMLVAQTLPLLVIAALGTESSSKSDVKRLFQMRQALAIIDFADSSSNSLRSLLLRVASSPLCLRLPEGKRLLASLFHVDGTLMRDMHQAMRVQIPDAKKTELQAYAEIYFRAWKEAPTTEIQDVVESEVLSDLMYAVIHVGNPNMTKSLLTVLEPFHDAKKNPAVEGLLHRMYAPILWRSMSAANAKVRVNAALVLAEVFPLQDASHTQTEASIRKGCTGLNSLLQDRDPRVRVAGSEAVAKILSTYWDVVPSTDIRTLLNHIVAEHASDASSSAVRSGALNAITLLLEAPQSHAVLRALLPSLGNLIHDKVEKVRLAAVRLLLRIKQVPGIKYYHCVPVDHLSARLADEGRHNSTGPVASALTALMVNSYFPQGPNVSGSAQIKRTIAFLTSDPIASAVFYANISDHLPVDAIAKLSAMLLRCLHSAVETDQKSAKKQAKGRKRLKFGMQAEDDEDDEENGDESFISASDTSLMANLAETICTLWHSIEDQLCQAGNQECDRFLMDSFSGVTLTNALTHFEIKAQESDVAGDDNAAGTRDDCHRICAAILRTAGRLPSKAVEGLVPHISSVLASLAQADSLGGPRPNVSAHIALLCLWDMTEEVAPSLAASIQSPFEGDHELIFGSPVSDSKKRKSGRNKKNDHLLAVPPLPPHVALEVLGDILRGSDPSSVAARGSIFASASACAAIEKALERGTKYAERLLSAASVYSESMNDSEIDYVLQVSEAFGRFALHKEASTNEGIKFSAQAERLLHWTTSNVVPAFSLSSENSVEKTPFSDLNLSRISPEKSFESLPGSPVPTGPPKRRANRNTTPVRLDDGTSAPFSMTSQKSSRESSTFLARAFAVSLMQSSCVIFSEWLAVGGSGSSEIAESAVKWCKIFDENNGHRDETQKELLPVFTRLAMQLCKTVQDFSLLKHLLISCNEVDDHDEMPPARKALSSLLSTRGTLAPVMVTKTVECVLEAAYSFTERVDFETPYELPASMEDVWPADEGCIVSGLGAILSNKQASLEFTGLLVGNFAASAHNSLASALFHAKCLWILCDPSASKSAAEATQIVRQLNVASLENESKLRGVVEDLLEGLA